MKTQLKELAQQVIVITGASSGIGLTTARMAAERGARLVLVDGAGHMCPAEQPAAVAEAFRAWLAQPEPAC